MKKTVSLLLLLTMLVLSVPMVTLNVIAADATPLTVTHVSCTENYSQNKGEAVDWRGGWDWSKENSKDSGRLTGQFDEDFEMVGKFSEPTHITSVTLCSQYYNSRMNGIRVYASEDSENWVELFVLSDLSGTAWFNEISVNVSAIAGEKEYLYVKVSKPLNVKDTKFGDSSTNNAVYVDFRWVAFYNDPTEAKTFSEVTHISASSSANAGIEAAWNFSNTTICRVPGNVKEEVMRGEFRYPTEITEIFIKLPAYQDRINHTAFEMSVDGETWKEVARITGGYKLPGEVIRLSVSDTATPYKYVRIMRNQEYSAWDVAGFGFVGTEHPEMAVHTSFNGFQRSSEADGTYAVKLICTADRTDYQKAGMKIVCTSEIGDKWNFDMQTTEFTDKTFQHTDTGEKEITAESLGGVAMYTAVLTGIPDNIGLFGITVTPYVYSDGEKTEGKTKTVVMRDTSAVIKTDYSLSEQKDKLKISGRSAELENGIACDFSASGIEFNAELAGDVSLKVNCSDVSYFTLYINGVRQEKRFRFIKGTEEYVIAEGLAAGKYNIKLVKQTHVAHSITELISVKMNGEFADRPDNNEILIEFIGDSITCGYGVVGYPANGVTYYGTADYCDATQAYAYKTAEILKSDYSMISVSGWAVLPDSSNSGCIPAIYGKTSYRRSDDTYSAERKADVIVVHLGTNDVNSRSNYETDFVGAAKEFLADVSEQNPDAKIIWIYGSMMKGDALTGFESKVNSVITDMGGAAAGYYSLKVPYNQSAGNGHPSADGHTETANVLAEFIKNNCLN